MDKSGPSRKAIIGWTVAMLAGLALAYFIGAVVWPVWRTHKAIERCSAGVLLMPKEIEKLGGAERAARRLSLYARLPGWIAGEKARAAVMLRFCGKPAVPALAGLLTDRSAEVRRNASGALGWIGPEAREAVPALTKLLGDRNTEVRAHAAVALGTIGPDAKESVPALQKLLQDGDQGVRQVAAEALKKIKAAQE